VNSSCHCPHRCPVSARSQMCLWRRDPSRWNGPPGTAHEEERISANMRCCLPVTCRTKSSRRLAYSSPVALMQRSNGSVIIAMDCARPPQRVYPKGRRAPDLEREALILRQQDEVAPIDDERRGKHVHGIVGDQKADGLPCTAPAVSEQAQSKWPRSAQATQWYEWATSRTWPRCTASCASSGVDLSFLKALLPADQARTARQRQHQQQQRNRAVATSASL
jgi:hypothetical protein